MPAIQTPTPLDIGAIIIGLFGGLALFLYGMELMTDGLKIVAGNRMQTLLGKATGNRFAGVVSGAAVTAVIQSSSVTTVLVVGFISAGLMTLSQSIGVIMGANIGTTITAQIIAFKVTKYALVLVAIGFGIFFFSHRKRTRQYGLMVLGLGLIFFGMTLMSQATEPLRSYPPFINLMQSMTNYWLAILLSAAFTALVQSSSATTGIVIVLAGQGFISLEVGISLVMGANLGTCVTAILAAIGKPPEAVRAALVHVLFNVFGVLIWLPFIPQLAELVRMVSPASTQLSGAAQLAADTPRQIANAHTIFNIANTAIFIWFTQPMAKLVIMLVPDKKRVEEIVQPRYLDHLLLETPTLALDRVRLELGRLGEYTLQMIYRSLPNITTGHADDLVDLAKMDDKIDALHSQIVLYLGQLSQGNMLTAQSKTQSSYLAVANYLENIGDMIETNLVETGNARLKNNVQISETTMQAIESLHNEVAWAVEQAMVAFRNQNPAIAAEVRNAKTEINRLVADLEAHLANRLIADEPNRLATFKIESEIAEYLKRVYYFAKRIAMIVQQLN